jgi:uncharacterized protein (TIGR02594 family)
MLDLPKEYNYLLADNIPRVIKEALKFYGLREVVGEDSNPVIIEWAQEIKPYVGIDYATDGTPWCGLFMGVVALRAKFTPPRICVRAKEWSKFGWENDKAEIGNILVFNRSGGGHVGLYVGEDKYYYHVLGGNQNDGVNIRRMSKQRCVSIRECPWKVSKPKGAVSKILDNSGKISYNEN